MTKEKKIIETGKKCVRVAGRFAGKQGKITKILDKNFVEVTYKTTKGEKAKRTNIDHIIVLNIKEKPEEKTIKEKPVSKKS
ncbi:MAG: 50S ribosomal protein L14e [Candidatus Aenigmarchaeota archaeon ex4484_52]|nr:MAG: 50S ribosomal protein L14e [Candidatus Aenigmarchaeota archaeon ex4484_52]